MFGKSHTVKAAKRSQWYICELVHECVVKGVKTKHVWVNIHLLAATGGEEAYAKAKKIGKSHNRSYRAGSEGRPAKWVFRGVRDLISMSDPEPTDGAELMFEAYSRITDVGLGRMIRPKSELSIFK